MKAVTWQGFRDVSWEEVADPIIKEPNDAIIKVTSTNICGSDLHLYETMGAFMSPGDVLGHEAMGIVLEVGRDIGRIRPGDRVVVPFQISCGHCWMCERSLYTQCEATQVRGEGSGAALFGYSKLYGQVPGGQAEYLRVPEAQFTHILVPEGPPDDRFIYLSDVLPTAWQAVEYAGVPDGGSLLVLGLGPIGDMACRIAQQKWIDTIIAVDLVDVRLERARSRGIQVIDLREHEDDLPRGSTRADRRSWSGLCDRRGGDGSARFASRGLRPARGSAPARCGNRAADDKGGAGSACRTLYSD